MPLRVSRTVALIAGVALPCIETWRRWPILPMFASWLDDIIAGVLLLYAWRAGRRSCADSRPYLMAAWGYTFGIAYVSFFGHLNNTSAPDPSGMPLAVVLGFKGFGVALSLACLALAWRSPRSQSSSSPKSG